MHKGNVNASTFCISSPEVLDGVTWQKPWYFRGGVVEDCLLLGYGRLNLTTLVAVR